MKAETELKNIIQAIKEKNSQRNDGKTISCDDTNEELLHILTVNMLCDNITDDEDFLADYFGLDGFHSIREAEQGMY